MAFRYSQFVFAALLFAGSVAAQDVAPIEDGNNQDGISSGGKSVDELLGMKKIQELQTNIYHPVPEKPVDKYAAIKTGEFQDQLFSGSAVLWDAPNICHHPLYYQDVGLERYSQHTGLFQPVLSGVHFFGRTATLPLHAMVRRPFSCDYPLGHYRPGNCNPYVHYSFPW